MKTSSVFSNALSITTILAQGFSSAPQLLSSNVSFIPATAEDAVLDFNWSQPILDWAYNLSAPVILPYSSDANSSDASPAANASEAVIESVRTINNTWTVNVTVEALSDNQTFQSRSAVSLTWPEEQQPNEHTDYWEVWAMGIQNTFEAQAPPLADGSCAPVFGEDCWQTLLMDTLQAAVVTWLRGDLDLHENGSVLFPIPDVCEDIFLHERNVSLVWQSLSSPDAPSNGVPFVRRAVNGTDADALGSQETSVVWPLFLFYSGEDATYSDGVQTGNPYNILTPTCIQAVNETTGQWPATSQETPAVVSGSDVQNTTNATSGKSAAAGAGGGMSMGMVVSLAMLVAMGMTL